MDRDDYQPIYEKIIDLGYENYDLLTKEQRVIKNVTPLVDLGIIDYYQNYGADRNHGTLEDLIYLDATETFEMIQKMKSLFPGGQPPSNTDERGDIMELWDDDEKIVNMIDDIDEKFRAHAERLENKLLLFAQKHTRN